MGYKNVLDPNRNVVNNESEFDFYNTTDKLVDQHVLSDKGNFLITHFNNGTGYSFAIHEFNSAGKSFTELEGKFDNIDSLDDEVEVIISVKEFNNDIPNTTVVFIGFAYYKHNKVIVWEFRNGPDENYMNKIIDIHRSDGKKFGYAFVMEPWFNTTTGVAEGIEEYSVDIVTSDIDKKEVYKFTYFHPQFFENYIKPEYVMNMDSSNFMKNITLSGDSVFGFHIFYSRKNRTIIESGTTTLNKFTFKDEYNTDNSFNNIHKDYYLIEYNYFYGYYYNRFKPLNLIETQNTNEMIFFYLLDDKIRATVINATNPTYLIYPNDDPVLDSYEITNIYSAINELRIKIEYFNNANTVNSQNEIVTTNYVRLYVLTANPGQLFNDGQGDLRIYDFFTEDYQKNESKSHQIDSKGLITVSQGTIGIQSIDKISFYKFSPCNVIANADKSFINPVTNGPYLYYSLNYNDLISLPMDIIVEINNLDKVKMNISSLKTAGNFSFQFSYRDVNNDLINLEYDQDMLENVIEFPETSTTSPYIFVTIFYDDELYRQLKFKLDSSQSLCFYEDTDIITDKGLVKIKNLTRGDMIQTLDGSFKPLARLNVQHSHEFSEYPYVKFPKDCFTQNVPSRDLLLSPPHPVVHNFVCRPANWYVGKIPGVELVKKGQTYYNLLFDTPEYLSVHGMCVTSHHPNHPDAPLKLEEYINPLNYRPGTFMEEVKTD